MNVRLPKVGERVNVIEKRNYENGKLTTGVVKRLLSNPKEVHPRGNKVELADGTVGRMVSFVDEAGVQTFVDPSEREKYAAEVRSLPRPDRRVDSRSSPSGRRFFDQKKGSEINAPAETRVNLADLPGEDDLR